jgi:hypothetical protein
MGFAPMKVCFILSDSSLLAKDSTVSSFLGTVQSNYPSQDTSLCSNFILTLNLYSYDMLMGQQKCLLANSKSKYSSRPCSKINISSPFLIIYTIYGSIVNSPAIAKWIFF